MTQITRSKWFVISFAVILVSNIVMVVMLFRNTEKPAEKKVSTFSQMVTDLQLDTIQHQIFRQRKDSFMKSMKPLWDDIRKSKYEMYLRLQHADTPDSVIHSLAIMIGEKTAVSEEMQYRHFRELRMVCTADQQVRFDTLVPQLMSRYRNRKQPMPPHTH